MCCLRFVICLPLLVFVVGLLFAVGWLVFVFVWVCLNLLFWLACEFLFGLVDIVGLMYLFWIVFQIVCWCFV